MDNIEIQVNLEPTDNERLANLCGQFDENLRYLEKKTGVSIGNRGNSFRLSGFDDEVLIKTEKVIKRLYHLTESSVVSTEDVHLELRGADTRFIDSDTTSNADFVKTRKIRVVARGEVQKSYLRSIRKSDICFGIGPAGTGKTYLAVASAVAALESDSVRRVCLVRPAVEAGERLGFLPGDMAQKIDPYLRPLYDALYEMLGFDRVSKLIEKGLIEVAPLAFMRGRSLNRSFIILDEAQNTTVEQMKMFLTRIGFGSKTVVTGDVTQIDLPSGRESGLKSVSGILNNVEGIGFNYFSSKDVVRHRLVGEILDAYDAYEKKQCRE
ncbi:MAG: PhoH family protein [Pseudomonadota bacterium]|nr:PhoH family protein [Pseudomonadota bacterium]